jgi:hypothetical protein
MHHEGPTLQETLCLLHFGWVRVLLPLEGFMGRDQNLQLGRVVLGFLVEEASLSLELFLKNSINSPMSKMIKS